MKVEKNKILEYVDNLVGIENINVISISFLVIIAVLIYEVLLMPQINLSGKKVLVLNYNERYKEAGYKASFLGENVTDDVVVSGDVNSKKLGEYKVIYKVKSGAFTRKVVRKVIVKDKSAPQIILANRSSIINVCPGKKYVREDYRAYDNYDGEVTKNVEVIEKKDSITYVVSDKAGNKRSITRKIVYEDKVKPDINLKGSDVVYSFLGEDYKEEGYEVFDDCDGNLSDKVKITGNVDTKKLGEYTLTYSVTDSSSNTSSVKRKVIVVEHGKNGSIYLTFDDGPKDGTTNVILDILKEEGVKATFFVTNNGPDELIKRAYDEGHTIALHTATHDYATVYASADAYFNDLLSVQDRVKRITGYEAKIIRFPGGSSNTISRRYSNGIMSFLTNEVLNRGFRYYDWNLSSGDAEAGSHSAEEIRDNVIRLLSKDRVNMVLMHDIKPYTRDALRDIIRYGKDNGYTFEKITMGTEMVTQKVNN